MQPYVKIALLLNPSNASLQLHSQLIKQFFGKQEFYFHDFAEFRIRELLKKSFTSYGKISMAQKVVSIMLNYSQTSFTIFKYVNV